MPKVNPDTLRCVQKAMEQYKAEVESTELTPNTKATYIHRAENFVRWLDDDFEPGGTLKK